MSLLHTPFGTDFMQRALVGGSLVAVICGIVGTWVVIRGMAFLGEAIGHGMLPGVALATLLGLPVVLGGAASAILMSATIGTLHRRGRLSYDTAIGLLFVAMLSLGVIIVSHSGSFATDATVMLFGDVLAMRGDDIAMLAVALVVTLALAIGFHRAFVAAAFDPRVAQVLGLRPALAQGVLVGLVTLAVVASYQAVGSLLVIGLLLAPAVAAGQWTRRIPTTMALASLLGVLAVVVGLLVSWHAATAAGSTIAYSAVVIAVLSALVRRASAALGRVRVALAAALLASATACSAGPGPTTTSSEPTSEESADDDHGEVAGAEEVAEPQLSLVTLDPTGGVGMLDLLTEEASALGAVAEPSAVATDGRYVFATVAGGVDVVDSGRWTWDHGDHFHYYRAEPRVVGTLPGRGEATVSTGRLSTAGGTGVFFGETGEAVLLDNAALADGELREVFRLEDEPHRGLVAPFAEGAVVSVPDGDGGTAAVQYVDAAGDPVPGLREHCTAAAGTITTTVGLAVGCADGALLWTEGEDGPAVERIGYPPSLDAPRAQSFHAREGRPTVAALAGRTGIWLLDTRERTWDLLDAGVPLVAVSASDDEDGHVVALDRAGRVRVYAAETGRQLAMTRPLLATSLRGDQGSVELAVDQERAYLNAPADGVVLEIDYADGARVARRLTTVPAPAFFAEAGR